MVNWSCGENTIVAADAALPVKSAIRSVFFVSFFFFVLVFLFLHAISCFNAQASRERSHRDRVPGICVTWLRVRAVGGGGAITWGATRDGGAAACTS
jgi:hypothetical protein